MAYKINEDCISCGACETECPNAAIKEGETTFVIDPNKCTECVGWFDKPKCAEVCPKAAIIFARRDLGSKLLMRGYTSGLVEPLVREIKSQASK